MKLHEAKAFIKDNPAPVIRADGSCPGCCNGSGGKCEYHQAAGLVKDAEAGVMLREVVASIRESDLARIMARFELESDEFYTARQKAEGLIGLA